MSIIIVLLLSIYNSNGALAMWSPTTFAHLFETFLAEGFGIQFDGPLGAVWQVYNTPHGWYFDSFLFFGFETKTKVKAIGFCFCFFLLLFLSLFSSGLLYFDFFALPRYENTKLNSISSPLTYKAPAALLLLASQLTSLPELQVAFALAVGKVGLSLKWGNPASVFVLFGISVFFLFLKLHF